MPRFTKIGSLLRDGPVLDEIRDLVGDGSGVGLPHSEALGIDSAVSDIVGESEERIERALATRPVSESVVVLTGRPALLVQGDSFQLPPLRTWRSRLLAAQSNLEEVLPSVGRVELFGSDIGYVGTGWMVGDRDVITNRHVAIAFAEPSRRGRFVISRDLTGRPHDVRVDFREEFQGFRAPYEVSVSKITHIEAREGQPDVAILRLATGATLPRPVELGSDPEAKQFVAVIGYPARDPEISVDVAQRIFGNVYDVKRLAPGQVIPGNTDEAQWAFSHDCTTLGGNSGSLVVDMDTGQAVGLHFAGAYRSANYAVKVSVVKRHLKTGAVSLSSPAQPGTSAELAARKTLLRRRRPPTAASYGDRAGYQPNFLGAQKSVRVPLPGIGKHRGAVSTLKSDKSEYALHYEHYSAVHHASRRLPLFTAVNIHGVELKRLPRPGENWEYDPRISKGNQVGNELYDDNDYDRGHMVRRLDPVWGPTAAKANDDTFHWTNCVPQHHDLNTKTWSDLEDYLLDNAEVHDLRVSVFTGPVLADDDPVYRSIQIPQEFWKIVAFRRADTTRLSITGYLLSQTNLLQPFGEEAPFVFGEYRTYQVPIGSIATATGLTLTAHAKHDPLRRREARMRFRRIDRLEQLTL